MNARGNEMASDNILCLKWRTFIVITSFHKEVTEMYYVMYNLFWNRIGSLFLIVNNIFFLKVDNLLDKYFLGLKKLTSRKYSCENGTVICQETNNFIIKAQDHDTFNESKFSTSLSIFIPFGINVNVIFVCVVFSLMLLKYFCCIGQFVKPSPVQTWCLSTRSCKSEKDCVVFRL